MQISWLQKYRKFKLRKWKCSSLLLQRNWKRSLASERAKAIMLIWIKYCFFVCTHGKMYISSCIRYHFWIVESCWNQSFYVLLLCTVYKLGSSLEVLWRCKLWLLQSQRWNLWNIFVCFKIHVVYSKLKTNGHKEDSQVLEDADKCAVDQPGFYFGLLFFM